jgi:enamine deaminase RidA (YjgF/YER057c/UK114 family)
VQKRYAWPKGHWDWPIKVTHKHGVRSDQMIWVGGQVDLTSSGTVLNAGDLATQTQNCMANFGRVVEELDASLVDLVKLLCFYVNDGTVDEQMFLETVGQALPEGARPAVTAVPVPYLAYPGMQVEIEGYAMLGEDHARLPRSYAVLPDVPALPTSFAQGVRCGRMIFISAQSPVDGDGSVAFPGDIVAQTKQVMVQIGRALGSFGASYDDVVKINRWYVGHGTIADFESAALACAAYFNEPGPAATGVPIPRHARDGQQIKIEVVAMLGEDDRPLPRRHAWPESLWTGTFICPTSMASNATA